MNEDELMKSKKLFKFEPKKEIWFVLLSWVLVISTFYISFQVITTQRVAAQFITFGIIGITLFGVIVPVLWTTLYKKRPLSILGIKTDKLGLSIMLSLFFSAIQYYLTLRTISLPDFYELVPLVTMALAVGFFENIFFRGWIQTRMEDYFGIIPGIILSAVIYSLYHIGYGMPSDELMLLLVIGLIYSSLFRITSNVFILFPLLTPMGALFTQIKDELILPFAATYGFLDVILLLIISLIVINKIFIKKQNKINTNETQLPNN